MQRLAFVSLLAWLVVGCGDGFAEHANGGSSSGDVGTVEQSVLAGTRYAGGSCTSAHRTVIRHAGILGRTIASSNAFEECLEDAMLNGGGPLTSVLDAAGPYRPCQLDPHRTASAAQRVQ